MSRTRPTSISLSGSASRRGPIRRLPTPGRLTLDIETWLTTEYATSVRSIRRQVRPTGEERLLVDFHPAAAPLEIVVSEAGQVDVTMDAVVAGPGYRRFVERVLERLGQELSIEWPAPSDDPTAAARFGDRATTEHDYLGWLGAALADAQAARRLGSGLQHLGTPSGVTYSIGGALATVLGPRDEAWLDAAIADPRLAIDIAPWWPDATDGRSLMNQALVLMWVEIRWRRPALEGEAECFDEVHRLLSRAYVIDPALPYPWTAWAEVASIRGLDDPMARQAIARAERDAEPPASPIGYRRLPVRISHAGWVLEGVPGSFAERRTDEEWWGGGAGRGITLAAVDTGAMSAEAFLDQVAPGLGSDVLEHRAGPIVGRGQLTSDASSGVAVGVVEGFSAVSGSGAVIRIVFDDPADWQWALETWRGLAPG